MEVRSISWNAPAVQAAAMAFIAKCRERKECTCYQKETLAFLRRGLLSDTLNAIEKKLHSVASLFKEEELLC